jgi:diguanylate cyclase (GGDEF)-like protein
LAEAFRSAKATEASLVVLMMDMDGLKRINDAHGHRMGAQTIRQVGAIIGDEIRGRGEATRFGGDEFCAFLPGAGEGDARVLAERLRVRVEQADFVLDDITVKATISIGIGIIGRSVGEWTVLQEKADRALYRAKLAGRNRTSV